MSSVAAMLIFVNRCTCVVLAVTLQCVAGRAASPIATSLTQTAGNQTAPCPGNTTALNILANASFSGKIVIVTGGDSGLGYGIAEALAMLKNTVIIGARNQTQSDQVAKNLSSATGATVESIPLDLGSLASVHRFADAFLKKYGPNLHVLINDAGIGKPSIKTADGFELVFEVDYLGHFLLTELLLPALRQSRPSRVINVASAGHKEACEGAGWPEQCFKDWTYIPTPVVTKDPHKSFVGPTYGAAKFLQIQHAKELSVREAPNGVKAYSINPGFVLTNATKGFDPSRPGSKLACAAQAHPPGLPAQACPFSAAQGAAVIAFCVTSPHAVSGRYYDRKFACEEGEVVTHGWTDAMTPELYRRSLAWAGISNSPVSVVV